MSAEKKLEEIIKQPGKYPELPEESVNLPWTKVLFDKFFSLLLILATSPLFVSAAFINIVVGLILKEDSGPLFATETRVSKGKKFNLIKFRIIKLKVIQNAIDENGYAVIKELEQNHDNVTFLGRILVMIYMDELPQIYNIFFGNMSFVGPRPKAIRDYEGLKAQGNRVLDVINAGLTGPFQSYKGNFDGRDQRMMDSEYALYIKNNSAAKVFFNDMVILGRTIKVVIESKGI